MSLSETIRPVFEITPPVQRVRPLGENFVLPRQHYVLHMPLIMLFVGIIVWMFGSEPMMVLAAATGSIVGFVLLVDWLFRRGPVRLSTTITMTLLLAYAFGALNTWLTLPRAGLGLAEFMGRDPGVLARAMASVLFSCAILLSLGELLERPVFSSDFRIPIDSRAYLLIYLSAGAIIAGLATGGLSTGGVGINNVGDYGEVSFVSVFLVWLLYPLLPFTVAVTLGTPRGWKKILLSLILLFLVVVMFTQGRRILLFNMVLCVYAVRLSGYRIKGSIWKKAILLGVLGAVVAVGVTAFMLLRISSYKLGKRSSTSERIRYLAEGAVLRESFSQAVAGNTGDVQRRTFMLGFYSDLLEGSARTMPALGRDLMEQVEFAMPRALFPGKQGLGSEEMLANEQFGLNYPDASNSLLTVGAIDFGLVGVLFLPLVLVWILRKLVEIVVWHVPKLVASFIVLSVLTIALQPELTVSSYILLVRNGALFSIALIAISHVPVFKFRT